MNALQLFKEGLDTIGIAERLSVSEAVAYSLLHHAREAERKKKDRSERQRIYNRNYQRRIRQEMREARAGV